MENFQYAATLKVVHSANKIAGIGQKEWKEQHAHEVSPHKRAYKNIDGTKHLQAHSYSSTMNINISVLFICPPLFHAPKRRYSYHIQNTEVLHHLRIGNIINVSDDEHM